MKNNFRRDFENFIEGESYIDFFSYYEECVFVIYILIGIKDILMRK